MNASISKKTYDIVSMCTTWCTATTFECAGANWFLDGNLHIHVYEALALKKQPYLIRTAFRDFKQVYSKHEFQRLQKRIERNTIALLLYFSERVDWQPTPLNVIAACITVAEVTEEISFLFNVKVPVASELLSATIKYALGDRGLLYKLCLLEK